MTLSELITHLTDLAESTDDDPQVRVAYQPNWPLRASLSNVTVTSDEDGNKFLWLAANTSASYGESPYAPHDAWDS